MSVLRPNVLITTARATYNSTADTTGDETVYLRNVPARLEEITMQALAALPDDLSFKEGYLLRVETGTDIVAGDTLTKVVLPNGVTTWPGDVPAAGAPGSGNSIWHVKFHREAMPGLLANRILYVDRERVGGPDHP